jgi:regulator of RNase E activity RraA
MYVSEEALARLAEVGSSTLTAVLFEHGFRSQYMEGISLMARGDDQRMVGRARTLRFVPLREDLVEAQYADLANSPHRRIIDSIERGEVLVVDTGPNVRTGVLGDMFLRRIRERGGVGVVIDGAFRDYTAVQTVGLPVFAAGTHGGAIPHKLISVGRDEPIRCGGVAVIPGDVIVGDADGVVAVPPHVAEDVAATAFEHALREHWIREKLDAGGALSDYYPPSGARLAELEAWLAKQ